MGYADIVLGVDSSDGFEALLEDLQAEAWELWDSGETTPDTCGEVSADALEPLSSTSGILQKGYTKQSVEVGGCSANSRSAASSLWMRLSPRHANGLAR